MSILAYHGSGTLIDAFDYRFTNQGNDQVGSGFYFTSSPEEAIAYMSNSISGKTKLGGEDLPTVHVVLLDIDRPLTPETTKAIRARDVDRIISASPILYDALMNWDDVDTYGLDRVKRKAINAYVGFKDDSPLLKVLFNLANDFFPESEHIRPFNEVVKAVFGFDGVRVDWGQKEHHVAWFPEQIDIRAVLHRKDFPDTSAMMEAIEAAGRALQASGTRMRR